MNTFLIVMGVAGLVLIFVAGLIDDDQVDWLGVLVGLVMSILSFALLAR